MAQYDLELEKAAEKIKESGAKNVLIQLPDGLKPRFGEVVDYLEKNTQAKIILWSESCFGSCDLPNVKGIDLLIQWGHAPPTELKPKVTRDDEQ